MKAIQPSIYSHSINLFRAAILTTVLVAAVWAIPRTARAQMIYAASTYNSVGEYSAGGTVINSGFITGLPNAVMSLAVSGNDVYVGTYDNIGIYNGSNGSLITNISTSYTPWFLAVSGTNLLAACWVNSGVYDYNANTGALITSSFVPVNGPEGLTVVGNDLYVASYSNGSVGEYNATTGAAINSSLITGLYDPMGIAVSGTDLFVATGGGGGSNDAIGEYNATTGATINASLTTLTMPWALDVSGNTLYASTNSGSSIYEINATSGASTGSFSVANSGLAMQSVPEPCTGAFVMGAAGLAWLVRRRAVGR
jgi:glutamine cyclotransferase